MTVIDIMARRPASEGWRTCHVCGCWEQGACWDDIAVQVQEGGGLQAAIDEAAEILGRDSDLTAKATSVEVRLASPADLSELDLITGS